MTRPHEILANDLLFAGRYANETEPQAAVRRLKRNESAARALLAMDDEVERLRAEVDSLKSEALTRT